MINITLKITKRKCKVKNASRAQAVCKNNCKNINTQIPAKTFNEANAYDEQSLTQKQKEIKHNEIKQRIEFEEKAKKELDITQWDEALEKVRNAVGITEENKNNKWKIFIGCLQFYKLYNTDIDNEIIMFIIMRMISATFLHAMALGCLLISLILLLTIVISAIINIVNICNIYGLIATYVDQPVFTSLATILAGMVALFFWIFFGLFVSASKNMEKSKNKTYISMIFGIVVTIILGICGIAIPIIAQNQ